MPAEVVELLENARGRADRRSDRKAQAVRGQAAVSDDDAVAALDEAEKKQHGDLLAADRNRWANSDVPFAMALAMTDSGTTAPPTNIFFQGDFSAPREEVPPGFLSVLDPNPAEIAPSPGGKTTGRRTALAQWIVSPDNPLTARVMVTRLWQQHFGHGLVETANDFGFPALGPRIPSCSIGWPCSLSNKAGRSSRCSG